MLTHQKNAFLSDKLCQIWQPYVEKPCHFCHSFGYIFLAWEFPALTNGVYVARLAARAAATATV